MTIVEALLQVPGARVDDLSTPVAVIVPTAEWVDAAQAAHAAGALQAQWLTAADFGSVLRVAVLLRGECDVILATDCTESALSSLCGVWAGLVWHERECAEMFGIEFSGHPDPRPLLLHDCDVTAPLRRTTALPSRAATPWPGAVTASGASVSDGPARGRRAVGLPPGVHPEWVASESASNAPSDAGVSAAGNASAPVSEPAGLSSNAQTSDGATHGA